VKAHRALLLVFACSPLIAHEDEPDLQLNSVKSIQVAGIVIAPRQLTLSLEDLVAPFRAALTKRGVKIDQNNYDNVISTDLEVTSATVGTTTIYAVQLSFHYTEPCSSIRLSLHTTCPLWEHYELLQTFDTPDAAEAVQRYVMSTVSAQAKEFAAQFHGH